MNCTSCDKEVTANTSSQLGLYRFCSTCNQRLFDSTDALREQFPDLFATELERRPPTGRTRKPVRHK